MILILPAYNCRQEFCQNLSKVQILDHYIIDAFRLLSPSSQLLRMILVYPDTNVIFEAFPWLKVNIHCNTYPALLPMRVVVCSAALFFSYKLFYFRNPAKLYFQETFDINHYHYCYCKFICCWQKQVLYNLEKRSYFKSSTRHISYHKNDIFAQKCKFYSFFLNLNF